VPVTSGSGAKSSTNYMPTLVLEKWLKRPAELGGEGAPASPPPPPPPPPAADDGDEEF
jgi:hypothetical protein